jgi:hypothetical protein
VQGYFNVWCGVCSAMLCDAVRARDIVESFMIGFVRTDIACQSNRFARVLKQEAFQEVLTLSSSS